MENNQTSKSKEITTTKSKDVSRELAVKDINTFEQAESLAEYIANSPVFNVAFKEFSKSEDGSEQSVVNKNAIITALLLGNELGFSPMVSITFGKKLNREAVIKVKRGQSMGLDPMAAMGNIYVFSTSQTEIVYTGIHVVNKILTDAGIKRTIKEDGSKPVYIYHYCKKDLANQSVLYDDTTKDDYVVINDGHNDSWVEEQVKKGKIPIYRTVTKRALVELRRGDEVIAIPYTLQQAIDADLYPGTKTNGDTSKGKNNWIAHPETHLVKMSIMLGARIIASDKLNGIYIDSELSQAVKLAKEDIEEAELVDVEEVPVK